MRASITVLGLAVAGVLLNAPPAFAEPGSVHGTETSVAYTVDDGDEARVDAVLSADSSEGGSGYYFSFFTFSDGELPTPSGTCQHDLDPNRDAVDCHTTEPPVLTLLTHGEDDVIRASANVGLREEDGPYVIPASTLIKTGRGADRISIFNLGADVYAGPGRDRIGPDTASANRNVDTPSDDVHGGSGVDTVTYRETIDRRVFVTLDGKANDGRRGDKDNIRPDVENVLGPQEGLTAVGSNKANRLTGNNGKDKLVGRGGADTLVGKKGNDFLDARDGRGADVVRCGAGDDRVLLDRGDRLADPNLCESVTYAARGR